jgi:myo-inositol-1(or 4)-monophosphatase
VTKPPTPAERAAFLAVAAEAARDAGEILLRHLGTIGRDVDRKSSRRDLVTAADVESERLLVARLREAFPDHAIEAEEEVKDPVARAGARWFLDPLDGTNNFVHELPFFAVSMGLLVDGVPEVAVVHAPRLDETFTATRGGGAFLNGRALRVPRTPELGDAPRKGCSSLCE